MSYNDYDWLGPGVYFWESNPQRGMEFAREASLRRGSKIAKPFVVGAIIELGSCLDLTTSSGIDQIRIAHQSSLALSKAGGWELPRNSSDGLRRYLDCAVIRRLHGILDDNGMPPIDSVKGIFLEGAPLTPAPASARKRTSRLRSAIWRASRVSFACPRKICGS